MRVPLPSRFWTDFVRKLVSADRVEFLTYEDLELEQDGDYQHGYPKEFAGWCQRVKTKEIDPDKVYVLIQHDADSTPHVTIETAEAERALGVRSSLMVHNRWFHDEELRDYIVQCPIDMDKLKALSTAGFCIGYHTNAAQLTDFQTDKVYDFFDEDVDALRRHLPVRVFSPHGGFGSRDGLINASFDYPAMARNKLSWVQNRFSVKFHGAYSDGGLVKRMIANADNLDIRLWYPKLLPGRRYRILIHPQYYSDAGFDRSLIAEEKWPAWYREYLALYDDNRPEGYWDVLDQELS